MNDFWVGCKIKAKPSSNHEYFYTNEERGFVGEVVRISRYGDLEVKTLEIDNPRLVGEIYDVDGSYFYPLGNEYTLEKIKNK